MGASLGAGGRGSRVAAPHGLGRRLLDRLRLFGGRFLRHGLDRVVRDGLGRDGGRPSTGLARGGNQLGDLGSVDGGGVQGVSLTALLDALLANLAQAQQLPARQEEGEGQKREESGGQECDDGQQVDLLDLPRQGQG